MGRGSHYVWWRHGLDRVERAVYGSGWAASAAFAAGLQGRLRVVEHRFTIRGWAPGSAVRVAFASDFHAGPLTDPRLFDRLASVLAGFQPDVVLLGGDYVSLDARHADQLLDRLRPVRPKLGTFAVLGNHDLWLDDPAVVEALRGAGIDVLVNEVRHLRSGASAIRLYGMDEPKTGRPAPPDWETDGGAASLVLMHSPLGLESLRERAFHVAFCGHTHGGQIALPGGVPIILPHGSGARRYSRGEFQLPGNSRLVVSRGVGMSDLPIRLFAPSEVHLCTLEPEGSAPPEQDHRSRTPLKSQAVAEIGVDHVTMEWPSARERSAP